jgi:acyl-CoA thioester hydrolase
MTISKKRFSFEVSPTDPPPIICEIRHRVLFNEVDVMGVMWFGNYCRLIDEAAARLSHVTGLTFGEFKQAGIMAPVKHVNIDYKLPLTLGEEVTVRAVMIWSDALRINIEYTILKEDGRVSAVAHMIQLLMEAQTMQPIFVEPPMFEAFRGRWRRGEIETLA